MGKLGEVNGYVRITRQSDHTTRAQKGVESQTVVLQLHRRKSQGPRVSLFCALQVLQPKTPLHSIYPENIPRQLPESMLVATGKGSLTYPVVIVSVGGIHCRAVLNTGAGSSYASAALLHRMGKQPVRREFKHIDMMMQASNSEIKIYDVIISSLTGGFQL